MGYYSTLSGQWSITPPLTDADIANVEHLACVRMRATEIVMDQATGLFRREYREVVPATEEVRKYYELVDELTELVAAFPEHVFEGYLIRGGDDPGDFERYWVTDGAVMSENAVLRWPDGTPL